LQLLVIFLEYEKTLLKVILLAKFNEFISLSASAVELRMDWAIEALKDPHQIRLLDILPFDARDLLYHIVEANYFSLAVELPDAVFFVDFLQELAKFEKRILVGLSKFEEGNCVMCLNDLLLVHRRN